MFVSRRSLSHRVVTTLFGVWFALLGVLPSAWRPCPMQVAEHSAAHGVGQHATRADNAADAPGESGHEMHMGAPSQPAAPDTPAPAHSCDCAAPCCGTTSVARLDHPVSLGAAALPVAESATAEPERPHTPSRDRRLPFANGPPDLTVG